MFAVVRHSLWRFCISYRQSFGHLNLSIFWLDQEMTTTWPYNLSPELILRAFCTIFRAWPVGAGLGAKFGRKRAET